MRRLIVPKLTHLGLAVLIFVAAGSHASAEEINAVWEASSGLLPDAVCPEWTLGDTASPEDPVLSSGTLEITTSADGENIFYVQSGSDISVPQLMVIEARLRRLSGTTSHSARAPGVVLFTVSPTVGNVLFIGADEVFLLAADLVRGTTATVDTDDSFHTYRIEVDTITGAIEVFYDGSFLLSGATFSDSNANGSVPRVFFGEGSSLATGSSRWDFVRHNASTTSQAAGAGACDKDSDGALAFEDCNDFDSSTFPGAAELCDSKDNDCDSSVPSTEFDNDADGFRVCQNDCDDADGDRHPQAVELPGNAVDENCDGSLGACDPNAFWRNHGQFVRCVTHEVDALVAGGQISEEQGESLVQSAAQSEVGKN